MAEEQARLESERRQRRVRMLGGVVLIAAAVVAVAIAISVSSGSSTPTLGTKQAKAEASTVNALLNGVPQSGNTLGSPTAKVTVTEFGDLECPVCKAFAEGAESNLIANDVHQGRVKLVYRSLDTATGNGPNASWFAPQQAAAMAAGLQQHEWNYVLLFYHFQGDETTSYVNDGFLNGLAKLIPSLNYSSWAANRSSPGLTAQVQADQQTAQTKGYTSTPTIVIQGPKGQSQPIVGDTDYGTLESAIKSVE